ncbi:MAG: PadR family transcriptional regulator [Oscillospiraceae bacterium]|jgi:PadR family transcriptional regulator PadR|nr:PadR family transcriptional regulator [Oscillospiraceae bacterium]
MEAQMKKGLLEMCVIFTIRDKTMYGYDIMKQMRQYFPDVNESTFYAILRRLNSEGYARITLGEESKGPTRKYYSITESGREYLNNALRDWRNIKEIITRIGIE